MKLLLGECHRITLMISEVSLGKWKEITDSYPTLKYKSNLTHWPLGNFNNFFKVILEVISVIGGSCISCEIALMWMPLGLTDDKSTLVQVIAWCRQATSITWGNVDPDLCCHMVSLGHNELNKICNLSAISYKDRIIQIVWWDCQSILLQGLQQWHRPG